MQRSVFHQLMDRESSTFTYILGDGEEAVIIDAVIENLERDLKLIAELHLKLKYIVETHVHADHITAADALRRTTGAKIAISRTSLVQGADILMDDGHNLNFGSQKINALATPGHTLSCMSLIWNDKVFTGDTLLIRGTGRSDFQGGSAEQLYDSITQKLFRLPGDTIVYPGHDYKGHTSSSIAQEKMHNPRIGGGKSKAEFVKIMSDLKLSYPQKIDIALPANLRCGAPA